MKRLLLLIAFVLICNESQAAIALGAHVAAAGTSGTSITTAGVTTSASGSTFIIWCAAATSSAVTITASDSKTNTYAQIGSNAIDATIGITVARFQKVNGTGGASHTFTCNNNSNIISAFAIEITGAATTTPLDIAGTPTVDAAAPYQSPLTGTLNSASEFILSAAFDNGTAASDTWSTSGGTPGFALIDSLAAANNTVTGAVSFEVVSATTTQQATFTSAQGTRFLIGIDTFKAAGGTAFTRTFVEAVAQFDTSSRIAGLARASADLGLTRDVGTRVFAGTRTSTEIAGPDDFAVTGKAYSRSAIDKSASATETPSRIYAAVRATTDLALTADAPARLFTGVRTSADAAIPGDSGVSGKAYTRAGVDAPSLVYEMVSRTFSAVRLFSDSTGNGSPGSTTSNANTAGAYESLFGGDFATRLVTMSRSVTDSAPAGDAATRSVSGVRTATDAVAGSDFALRVRGVGRSGNEAANPADGLNRALTMSRAVADAAGISDQSTHSQSSATPGIPGGLGISGVGP